jgi:hypothetical protein
MWRISRTSGTLQEILIMASMNLLHTSRNDKLAMRSHWGDDDSHGGYYQEECDPSAHVA